MIDFKWKPKLNPDGTIAFDQGEEEEFTKVSPAFGRKRKRQAQLVARLKTRRRYPSPVRGGTGKQYRTRRRKLG